MDKVIVITGPTAVGKTKLSIELAKKLNGEIINADSTQIFKELDIATAKVTEKEKEGIKHHLIDIKNINEEYTVFDYQKDCRKKIEEIQKQGKTPILVGGTGLYIKAALYEYEFEEFEQKEEYGSSTNEELFEKLSLIDPNHEVHINNRKRLIATLNRNGEKKQGKDNILYDTIFIGLTTSREILYERINNRVDIMMENGLLEEARKIFEMNVRTKAVMTPIGYKELFEYFENKMTLNEAIELIKQRSRRYAKKQYTWFNNQMNIHWIEVNFDNFEETIKKAIYYINDIEK